MIDGSPFTLMNPSSATTQVVTVHSDFAAAPFTIKLIDTNYKSWSRMMMLHVTGTIVTVPEGDSGNAKWSKEDFTVRG